MEVEISSAEVEEAAIDAIVREYEADGVIPSVLANWAEEQRIKRNVYSFLEKLPNAVKQSVELLRTRLKRLSDLDQKIALAEKQYGEALARLQPVRAEVAGWESRLKAAKADYAQLMSEVDRVSSHFSTPPDGTAAS